MAHKARCATPDLAPLIAGAGGPVTVIAGVRRQWSRQSARMAR